MTPTGLASPPQDPELHDPALAEAGAEARPVIAARMRRALPQRFIGPPLWISAAAHLIVVVALLLYAQFGPESTPLPIGRTATVEYVDLVVPSDLPAAEAPAADEPAAPAAEVSPDTPAPTQPAAQEPAAGAPPRIITSGGGEQTVPPEQEAGGGGGGVAERLRPGFRDPRLYTDPGLGRLQQPGPSDAQRYQEHLQARIDALNDSMYGGSGPNTDWTVKDGSGRRWGVSEDGVHLGPLTIPRALVPFPAASGTNQDLEQEREIRRQREEIQRQEADRERRRALQERNAEARERRGQQGGSGEDPGS